MADQLPDQLGYLHDAYVHSITLTIETSGRRLLTMNVHCHPECGFADWEDQKLMLQFVEPLIIIGELYGHMANPEEINTFDFVVGPKMSARIKQLTDAGIAPPKTVASVVFQSGSQLEIACEDIRWTGREN
jgi:hypothetical protein